MPRGTVVGSKESAQLDASELALVSTETTPSHITLPIMHTITHTITSVAPQSLLSARLCSLADTFVVGRVSLATTSYSGLPVKLVRVRL